MLEQRYVELAHVQETFRVGDRDVLAVLRTVRVEMVDELMTRLADGKITPRNLDGQRRSAFRGARRSRSALVRVFRGIGKQGIEHVSDELARQES